MTKCGENISDTLIPALCSTFLFLPHFDVICDLLLTDALQQGIHLLILVTNVLFVRCAVIL